MPKAALQGIHHITAIAGDPVRNAQFYRAVLGLRLVKKTVNFDDPKTYHLYFGDTAGSPGTILTFFPWPGSRPGRLGAGMIESISFAVPRGSLTFWRQRLVDAGVTVAVRTPRFGEVGLRFSDPEGMQLELVETDQTAGEPWTEHIAADRAIAGFYGATERVHSFGSTQDFLTGQLGFRLGNEESGIRRYQSGGGGIGHYELIADPDRPHAVGGRGTVHHIAWMTPDLAASERWRSRLVEEGHHVSSVMDRKYFRSIYFREPAGVLFELATNGPGFAVDEPADALGSALMLPAMFEPQRKNIEAILPALDT